MKVCFFAADKERERIVSDAFVRGVRAHGDEGVVAGKNAVKHCDVAVFFGVKSRKLWAQHVNAGRQVVMVDKGLFRSGRHYRVSVGAHHPTGYIMSRPCPHDRFEKLNIPVRPWRGKGDHIVLAGSSRKYHDFHGLPDPSAYAADLVRKISRITGRQIYYRPKPSWKEAKPVMGARFSDPSADLGRLLQSAWVMVTHGSNACAEAIAAGVPCIVLGDAVARPISSTSIEDIERPLQVSDADRAQWFANLAYQQWTLPELARGEAWQHLRGLLA